MVLLLPLILPLLVALLAFLLHDGRRVAAASLIGGGLELALIVNIAVQVHRHGAVAWGRYFRADGLTSLFLASLGVVVLVTLLYSVSYWRHGSPGRFASPRWFYLLMFLFLFTMLAAYLAQNLGLLWMMMDATTLASALLVGFHNTDRAVEAGWKYLMVCTVGIAFALFGTIALYLAAVRSGIPAPDALDWTTLMTADLSHVASLVKLGFLFVAVCYRTQVGFVAGDSGRPGPPTRSPHPFHAIRSPAVLSVCMC